VTGLDEGASLVDDWRRAGEELAVGAGRQQAKAGDPEQRLAQGCSVVVRCGEDNRGALNGGR
jgi:hypothetical protein